MNEVKADTEAMRRHLEHLGHDGRIEGAWREPDDAWRRAQLFDPTPEGHSALIALAVRHNSIPGRNVGIGAAVRSAAAHQGHRNGAKGVAHSHVLWADIDDDAAVRNLRQTCGKVLPNFAVITGRKPGLRAHCYWKVEDPVGNLDRLQAVNKAIAERVGGDKQATDPGRILRLAGTIGWAVKEGRIVEPVTFHISTDPDVPRAYTVEEILAAFPPPPPPPRGAAGSREPDRWVALLRDGVAEGGRNTSAAELLGHLLHQPGPRRVITIAEAWEILRLWNEARCRPPLDDAELETVYRSIVSRELGLEAA